MLWKVSRQVVFFAGLIAISAFVSAYVAFLMGHYSSQSENVPNELASDEGHRDSELIMTEVNAILPKRREFCNVKRQNDTFEDPEIFHEKYRIEERFIERTVNGRLVGKIMIKTYWPTGKTSSWKPSLLVVNGGPGVAHNYTTIPLKWLAAKAARPVVFYDQLGTGKSPLYETVSDSIKFDYLWTVGGFVEEIGLIVKEMKLIKFHLFGNAWGAALALEYAAATSRKSPNLLSLTLASPFLQARWWYADNMERVKQMDAKYQKWLKFPPESPEYQSAVQKFQSIHFSRLNPSPSIFEYSFENINTAMYAYMWGTDPFECVGSLSSYNGTPLLKKVNIPVYLTLGGYDQVSVTTMQTYFSLLTRTPLSEIDVFCEASQCFHLEKPNAFYSNLKEYLHKNDEYK